MQVISPIFAKELRPLLRSRKAFWLMLVMLAGVGAMFVSGWILLGASRSLTRDRSAFGRDLFTLVSIAQLLLFGLFAPILTAVSITGEREERTLELLTTTILPRGKILWHKWWAAVAYQLLAVVLMLPMLTLNFQLGGVSRSEWLASTAITLVAVATYGMLGMAVSSWMRKSAAALSATLAIVLLINLGIPIAFEFLSDWMRWRAFYGSFLEDLATFWSPLIVRLRTTQLNGGNYPLLLSLHFVFQCVLFVVAARVAWRGLGRREMARIAVAKKLIDDPRLLEQRRKRFPYYVLDPLRRPHNIADGDNPILVREMRTGALSSPSSLIRLCYVGVGLSVTLGVYFMIGSAAEASRGFGLLLVGLSAIMLPPLAAVAISKEREEGTLDLLLTAPISPQRIVFAKFRVAMHLAAALNLSFLAPAYLIFVGLLLGRIGAAGDWQEIVRGFVPLLLFLAAFNSLFAAVALYWSSRARRTAFALVASYLSIFGLALLPYWVAYGDMLLTYSQSRYTRDHGPFADIISILGPIFSPVFFQINPYNDASQVRGNLGFHDANAGLHIGWLVYPILTLLLARWILQRTAGRIEKQMRA